VVCRAFRRQGAEAFSCDILDRDDPYHIRADVLTVLKDGWDLMIAHPPCTDLAVSGAHLFKKKLKEDPFCQIEALEFVAALMLAPIPKIAVENPVSIISTHIRKPDQIIQPYECYFQYGSHALNAGNDDCWSCSRPM
jgi:hypothetical protein